jgi:hypothetical protein
MSGRVPDGSDSSGECGPSRPAESLVVLETTAKMHVGRVLMELGLRDLVQAVVHAYEGGVVTIGHHPAAGR